MAEDVYFAWLALGSDYRPQKWYGLPMDNTRNKPLYTVDPNGKLRMLQKLHPDEYDLSLDELKEKYPYTGVQT